MRSRVDMNNYFNNQLIWIILMINQLTLYKDLTKQSFGKFGINNRSIIGCQYRPKYLCSSLNIYFSTE